MSKNFIALTCAITCSFLWGTAFIAQDTGMDNIGPLSFNAARFFVGFLTILPIAIILERKKNTIKHIKQQNHQTTQESFLSKKHKKNVLSRPI